MFKIKTILKDGKFEHEIKEEQDMGKMIRKTMCGNKIRSVDLSTFTVECVMSDETIDRYDEIIRAEAYRKGLKAFGEHAVLLSSHKYHDDLRNQIGEWEKVWIDGKSLVGRAKYYVGEGNPEADWGFKLAQKGIAAYSVGFRPVKAETLDYDKYQELKDKGKKVARRIYTEVELLETSQVLLPANPSALQRSVDEKDMDADAAQYYLDNIDVLKDFEDIEVTETDIADKFLIKDLEIEEVVVEEKVVAPVAEEVPVVAEPLVEDKVKPLVEEKVVEPEVIVVEPIVDAKTKGLEELSEEVAKMLQEFKAELSTKLELEISKISEVVVNKVETLIISLSTKLDDIASSVNVKSIVPNDSYIETVLNVDAGPELDESDVNAIVDPPAEEKKEYDPDMLKKLDEALAGLALVTANLKK